MNKLHFFVLFLMMLHQTHTAQASDISHVLDLFKNGSISSTIYFNPYNSPDGSFSREELDLLITKFGFTMIQTTSYYYPWIITNTLGISYRMDRNRKLLTHHVEVPRERKSTEEYCISKYANSSQRKTCRNGDELVRIPGHDDWIPVPAQMRHLLHV